MKIITDEIGDVRHTLIGDMKIIDTKIVRHSNGKIFIRYLYDNLLDKLAQDMKKNIEDHYDNIVIVQGAEGSGKSNLAYWGCKKFDKNFEIEKGYVYDFDTFKDILAHQNLKGRTFWLDETSNMANNRDWNTSNNKDLVEFLEMMRSKSITFFGCIPHYERLDIYIRENRIRYLITCQPLQFDQRGLLKRGAFELQKKDEFGVMRHVGYGLYDKIPEDDSKIYEDIKLESQQKKIDEIVNRDKKDGSKYKKMYEERCKKERGIMLTMSESGIDHDHIMQLFGYDDRQQYYNAIGKAKKDRERTY